MSAGFHIKVKTDHACVIATFLSEFCLESVAVGRNINDRYNVRVSYVVGACSPGFLGVNKSNCNAVNTSIGMWRSTR